MPFTGLTGGGGGFALGQPQNVFTGTTRTAAEAARDTYQAANAPWLLSYDTNDAGSDNPVHIRLEYTDSGNNVVVYQNRTDSASPAWQDVQSAIGIKGDPGDGLDLTGLPINSIPVVTSATTLGASPMMVDGGDVFLPGSLQVGLNTILLGKSQGQATHSISALGENIGFANRVSNTVYTPGSWSDGSAEGNWYPLHRTPGTFHDMEVQQAEITHQITNPSFVTPLAGNRRDYKARFNFAQTITNVILTILENSKPIFTSNAFDITTTGNNDFDLSVAEGNAGYVDLHGNTAYTVTLASEDGDVVVLGNSTGIPYLALTYQEWRDVRLATIEQLPAAPHISANINQFEISGQSNSILAGSSITGSRLFNYHVNHPEDVSGNLTLSQDGVTIRSDISPSGMFFSQAVNSVQLQNNQQTVFTLSGETLDNHPLAAHFTIRAHLPAEQLFYGLSASNNPATVSTASLQFIEAGVDGSSISTGTTTAGQYFIVLVPANFGVDSIKDRDGLDVTNIFTRTGNVRSIGAVPYHSYVVGPLVAGGNESYTLEFV